LLCLGADADAVGRGDACDHHLSNSSLILGVTCNFIVLKITKLTDHTWGWCEELNGLVSQHHCSWSL